MQESSASIYSNCETGLAGLILRGAAAAAYEAQRLLLDVYPNGCTGAPSIRNCVPDTMTFSPFCSPPRTA
jgi:hypothetical protein